MVATLPSDTHVVSDTGHTLAHNNLVDCLSAITGAAPGGSVTVSQTIATLLPITVLGDLLYENATPAPTRLPGNTTTTKKFLTQTGTGTVSAAPGWNTIVGSDLLEIQNYGGIFGDGSDGAVVFDGSTTILGMVPSGSAYTMTRDIFCTSITINGGVTLKPHGYRIFCQGTITINGFITENGNNASGTNNGTGGGAIGSGSLGSGRAGANGATGAGTTPASANTDIGTAGAGGAGGTAGGTAGGGVPGSATSIPTALAICAHQPYHALSGVLTLFLTQVLWAITGGSSGAGDGTNVGGGGGSGGGAIIIFAWNVINNGTISANGGNGGTPTTAAANLGVGGGGGGSGGIILVYTLVAWTAGTTSVLAGSGGTGLNGAGGSGAGTGGNGNAGAVLNVLVQ